MNTRFKKSYERDLKKIVDETLKAGIKQSVRSVKTAQTTQDIPSLKKLKGYKIHYRIRIGGYRIGVTIEGYLVTFARCLPRKDFYKYFP